MRISDLLITAAHGDFRSSWVERTSSSGRRFLSCYTVVTLLGVILRWVHANRAISASLGWRKWIEVSNTVLIDYSTHWVLNTWNSDVHFSAWQQWIAILVRHLHGDIVNRSACSPWIVVTAQTSPVRNCGEWAWDEGDRCRSTHCVWLITLRCRDGEISRLRAGHRGSVSAIWVLLELGEGCCCTVWAGGSQLHRITHIIGDHLAVLIGQRDGHWAACFTISHHGRAMGGAHLNVWLSWCRLFEGDWCGAANLSVTDTHLERRGTSFLRGNSYRVGAVAVIDNLRLYLLTVFASYRQIVSVSDRLAIFILQGNGEARLTICARAIRNRNGSLAWLANAGVSRVSRQGRSGCNQILRRDGVLRATNSDRCGTIVVDDNVRSTWNGLVDIVLDLLLLVIGEVVRILNWSFLVNLKAGKNASWSGELRASGFGTRKWVHAV